MNPRASILFSLSLANNGYTYRRNMSAQDRARADAAVMAGLASKRSIYWGRAIGAHMDVDPVVYELTAAGRAAALKVAA